MKAAVAARLDREVWALGPHLLALQEWTDALVNEAARARGRMGGATRAPCEETAVAELTAAAREEARLDPPLPLQGSAEERRVMYEIRALEKARRQLRRGLRVRSSLLRSLSPVCLRRLARFGLYCSEVSQARCALSFALRVPGGFLLLRRLRRRLSGALLAPFPCSALPVSLRGGPPSSPPSCRRASVFPPARDASSRASRPFARLAPPCSRPSSSAWRSSVCWPPPPCGPPGVQDPHARERARGKKRPGSCPRDGAGRRPATQGCSRPTQGSRRAGATGRRPWSRRRSARRRSRQRWRPSSRLARAGPGAGASARRRCQSSPPGGSAANSRRRRR